VPAEQLRAHVGLTSVSARSGKAPLAIVDAPLAKA
jgi:hypothetical protein